MTVLRSKAAMAAVAILSASVGLGGVGGSASAAIEHPTVVLEDPVDYTPHLVDDGSRPAALAVARRENMMYVGGRFSAVEDATRTITTPRDGLVAFDATTGALAAGFAPTFDGPVFALRAGGDFIFVGGKFTTVNGVPRPAIAKLDAETGLLDPTFQPAISNGRVSEIRLVDGRVLVSGTFPENLLALNPETGRDTGYVDIPIEGQLALTTSKTDVYHFAVNPQRTRLVAVGNFAGVDGRYRPRAFMLNLGASSAALSRWHYAPLKDRCQSRKPNRQAYLTDVDFSPDGSYFVFSSTGFVTALESQIGTHLCDAAARFETAVVAPDAPTWINYTGGDTLHSVAATGAAVYVQGHNRWLDNPYGRDTKGPGAVDRLGIGAIDPDTGLALPWNPDKPARQGGHDFLSTPTGLWVPSDSQFFAGEYHRGIAFVPLP